MGSCEQVRAEAPEVLVLMQCGASPQGALPCVSELAALPGWWGLPAVKNGWVFVVDHAPFLRPGPRVVRAAPFQASQPMRPPKPWLSFLAANLHSMSHRPCKHLIMLLHDPH